MKRNYVFSCLLVFLFLGVNAQDAVMSLWGEKVPSQNLTSEKEKKEKGNALWITNVQKPTIEVYLPSKGNANGKAMLIFPGGGYHGLAYDWEGTDVAKMLNAMGIAGIVVKYRLPLSVSLIEKKNVPLQDAQRAIRLVRSNAKEWNIDKNKIGIMGFSAGGHLASTLGTHYNENVYEAIDEVDSLSARPDFMALIYPVISFNGDFTHMGSREALIGKKPSETLIQYFSNELWVTKETPPTFLLHTVDDGSVPVENSLVFFKALKEKKVVTSMHIYPEGGHGYSFALDNPYLNNWVTNLEAWLLSLD